MMKAYALVCETILESEIVFTESDVDSHCKSGFDVVGVIDVTPSEQSFLDYLYSLDNNSFGIVSWSTSTAINTAVTDNVTDFLQRQLELIDFVADHKYY